MEKPLIILVSYLLRPSWDISKELQLITKKVYKDNNTACIRHLICLHKYKNIKGFEYKQVKWPITD